MNRLRASPQHTVPAFLSPTVTQGPPRHPYHPHTSLSGPEAPFAPRPEKMQCGEEGWYSTRVACLLGPHPLCILPGVPQTLAQGTAHRDEVSIFLQEGLLKAWLCVLSQLRVSPRAGRSRLWQEVTGSR